eukprot:1148284-Pelagomonas_calceolata.AAC.1
MEQGEQSKQAVELPDTLSIKRPFQMNSSQARPEDVARLLTRSYTFKKDQRHESNSSITMGSEQTITLEAEGCGAGHQLHSQLCPSCNASPDTVFVQAPHLANPCIRATVKEARPSKYAHGHTHSRGGSSSSSSRSCTPASEA